MWIYAHNTFLEFVAILPASEFSKLQPFGAVRKHGQVKLEDESQVW